EHEQCFAAGPAGPAVPPRSTPTPGRAVSKPRLAVWVHAARLRQWPKNLLVFGAPVAAGALSDWGVVARGTIAALAFCLLSSGAYLLNDLRDATEDRRHPIKRHRPIASRMIAPGRAFVVAAGAIATALILSAMLGSVFLAVAISYALLNFAYTARLRSVAV